MTFNPSSRLGHGALKKETSVGVAVIPNVFFEVISETMLIEWGKTKISAVAGKIDNTMRQVKNNVPISGNVEAYIEPNTLGYFLQHFFGVPSATTLEASASYLHEFTMSNDPATFTYEFQAADSGYVHRYFGCRVTKLAWAIEDNKIKLTMDITAQKAFSNARVLTEVSSGTALNLDQSSGLVATDVLQFLNPSTFAVIDEYAVSSITDEKNIVVATIDETLAVDTIVVIKGQAPALSNYSLSQEMLFSKAETKMGVDIDNTAQVDFEDFTFEMSREPKVFFAATGCDVVDRMASAVKLLGFEAIGKVEKFYETEEFFDQLRSKEKVAIRTRVCGIQLASNAIAQATRDYGTGTGFSVTASAAGAFDGEAGNDLNVVLEVASDDILVAAISGNTVTVSLANTTASKNTGTLIAAAIDALTGVDSAAVSTGAQEFTAAASKVNLLGGRDANESELMQIDYFDANYEPFNSGIVEDEIQQQSIDFMGSLDEDNGATVKVSLRNAIVSYT